jgi:hypothetical protein
LAEVDEFFVCGQGGLVVAVDAAAVVDPAVGAIDDPAAGLDDQPVARFRPGHHIHRDTGLRRCGGDGLAGVALVDPQVADRGGDRRGLAQQCRKRRTILHVRFGDDGGDQDAGGVDESVPVEAVDLVAPSHPRGPATGDAFTLEEASTAAVGRRRRPERVRTSPRTVVRIGAQVRSRHQRRTWLWVADQDTVKSCVVRVLSVPGETLNGDGTAHHIPVLSRSDGRAACSVGPSRRGVAIRVQPVPTDREICADPTQNGPGHCGAVDGVRSDQRVQCVEEDRGRRPGVHRRCHR